MIAQKFNNLPVLKSYEGLAIGDSLYTRKYGIGQVASFYNDEIIVHFQNVKRRLSTIEDEVSKIPDSYFSKTKSKMEIEYRNKSMTFKEFKKLRKREKIREKYERLKKSDKTLWPETLT